MSAESTTSLGTLPSMAAAEPFMQFRRLFFLNGPNIWSRSPCMEVWVDLGRLKDFSSEMIPGFNQRYKAWLPGVIEHRCSVGERGGFFQRLDRGTYLAHILEHTTLELQTLAGSEVGFGRAREMSEDGVYKVAIRYEEETLATACLYAARDLLKACIYDLPYDVPSTVDSLQVLGSRVLGDAFTKSWLTAARKRHIPVRCADDSSHWIFGHGRQQFRVELPPLPPFPDDWNLADTIDKRLPDPTQTRIPIITVIGSQQAEATVRLIKDWMMAQHYTVGWSAGTGLYLNHDMLDDQSTCSSEHMRRILADQRCSAAVIALRPESILQRGLEMDWGDIAIVTDVDWEVELGGPFDLFNRDKVFAVYRCGVDVILPSGTAILNADDPMALEMKSLSQAGVILYASDATQPALEEHRMQGSTIITVHEDQIVVMEGQETAVPLGSYQYEAQLPATAALYFLQNRAQSIQRTNAPL